MDRPSGRGGIVANAEPDDTNLSQSDSVERLKAAVTARRFDDAVAAWSQVDPTHAKYEGARLLLAEALLGTDPALSRMLLEAAVAHNPSSVKALNLQVRASIALADPPGVAATYGRLFRLMPEHAETAARYAEALPPWTPVTPRRDTPAEIVRDLYLTLLEKAVSNWIYGDGFIERGAIRPYEPMRRDLGKDIPAVAHSMIGLRRLRNLRVLAETVLTEGIPGDFLEAGVWRGGACILLQGVLKAWDEPRRRVWVADSFAGLPPPDDRYEKDRLSTFDFHTRPELSVSLEQVKENFSRYDLLDERVVFVKGLFRDTLPNLRPLELSILRLDGDLYSSTMDTLTQLYDCVAPGGFVIIDDYGVVIDARRAVLDFRKARGIDAAMIAIDKDGVFWRKPVAATDLRP
jgi:O-methyltransferase/8-demethyl-8-(2,3-dimethoxy-alpha-L-rhamnosyl)tetracenomycin-C 4'-O-methyltransferase